MLLRIQAVLTPAEVQRALSLLADAPWHDGRATSGEQSAQAKNNEQLPESAEATRTLQQMVLAGLERSPLFLSATLPKQISPPMFNRYSGATNHFGSHVDSAMRFLRGGVGRVRTDISCTLFLADPKSYDGGELVIETVQGVQSIKLAAGDMVVYPGTSVHQVAPVTRGARLASFFWVQSMVRSVEQRELLLSMDNYLRHLRSTVGEGDPGVIGLTGTYHNLLRLWADA